MGGLEEDAVTFWKFLVGTWHSAVFPPLSGFFSKDAISLQTLIMGRCFSRCRCGCAHHVLYVPLVFVAFGGSGANGGWTCQECLGLVLAAAILAFSDHGG